MIKYIIRRLIQSIPIFFGITILSYALMSAAPGGPVAALTFGSRLRAEDIEKFRYQLGLGDSVVVQYLRWLAGDDWMRWDSNNDGVADGSFLVSMTTPSGEPLPPGERKGILRGDFGRSFVGKRAVLDLLTERIPATLELGVTSLVVGAVLGLVVGVIAAVRYNSWFDHGMRIFAAIFDAVPIFFLGLLLLLIFGAELKILPIADRCKTSIMDTCPPLFQRLEYIILPTFVIAIGIISAWSRFMRASMLDIVSQDYIRTAKAKGLSDRQVWFRHGMRNALIPIATFLGPAITGILGGAVFTETIFNWPGLGRTIVQATTARDFPVVMAATVYAGVATILGYLLSDILYGLIDPRIRYN